jgi:hypothetical protein
MGIALTDMNAYSHAPGVVLTNISQINDAVESDSSKSHHKCEFRTDAEKFHVLKDPTTFGCCNLSLGINYNGDIFCHPK